MGDNRDCSKDSRFLEEVGYVKKLNLVGKAKYFFSNDTKKSSMLKFWNIHKSFRLNRTFQRYNDKPLKELEEIIKYYFKDKDLLRKALHIKALTVRIITKSLNF